MTDLRAEVRSLATAARARGDESGWFDELYRAAGGDVDAIPWADEVANPGLVTWLSDESLRDQRPAPGRALVVGCGLGDDAECLAREGWDVVAFDLSPEAIRWARRRFPGSSVEYRAEDLFTAPKSWNSAFDLVVEIYTLQAMSREMRGKAMSMLARWPAPGGQLLLIARGREDGAPLGELPWPLSRRELEGLRRSGLNEVFFEEFVDPAESAVRRFRALYRRPPGG